MAEFLLRKTRAETVNAFLATFFQKFSSFRDIEKSKIQTLRKQLKPLGLHNQRACALKRIALILESKRSLKYAEILNLPHCGRYIANAVRCFYYGDRRAIVDNNIQRVFNRFFSIPKAVELHKADDMWNFATGLLPKKNFIRYNYNVLDFTAMVCRPRGPKCDICPIRQDCDMM